MAELLERTRKINRLLQRSENVEHSDIARVLSTVLEANVYITDKQGKVVGHAFIDDFECSLMIDKVIDRGRFPKAYVTWLNRLDETSANRRSKTGMCAYDDKAKCMFNGKNTTIVPVYGVGERIGTLIVAKYDDEFSDDDLLLAEYGATVVGMQMLRDRSRKVEVEVRKRAAVEIALNKLSYSEIDATIGILDGLKERRAEAEEHMRQNEELGEERRRALDEHRKELANREKELKSRTPPGHLSAKDAKELERLRWLLSPLNPDVVITSRIAEGASVTRSVVVNTLRKFESAGIIESKSLGMKGTYIKVLNEYLLEEVQKLRNEQ